MDHIPEKSDENSQVYPVAQAVHYPSLTNGNTFLNVRSVEIPRNYGPCAISPQLWGILQYSQSLSIRQHEKPQPKTWPTTADDCFQSYPNTYSIYAGLSSDDQAEILRVDEVSVIYVLEVVLIT
jgi:hypothetical protein